MASGFDNVMIMITMIPKMIIMIIKYDDDYEVRLICQEGQSCREREITSWILALTRLCLSSHLPS